MLRISSIGTITLLSVLFTFTSLGSLVADATSKEIFDKAREAYYSNWPDQFIANVYGKDVDSELAEIPANQKKGTPQVYFFFKQKCQLTQRLLINNVHEVQYSRLESYILMLDTFAQFLSPSTSYKQFTSMYEWKVHLQNSKTVKIKMRYKNRSENNFFLIEFDPKSYLIESGEQYIDGRKRGELSIVYKTIGGKKLPVTLFGKATVLSKGKKTDKQFLFRLRNHKSNVKLRCGDFLDEESLLKKA